MNAYLYIHKNTNQWYRIQHFSTSFVTNIILMQILNNAAAKQGKKFIHDLIN